MNNLSDLLIIGDSVALGAAEVRGNDIVEYIQPTCVDLLKAALPHLTVRIDAQVRRNSVSVRDEIDALIEKHHPAHTLLLIGGSDADMDWKRFIVSDGKVARNRVPVERYEKNMRHICERLIAAGATPILTDVHNHNFAICGPYVAALTGKDIPAMIINGGGQSESDRHLMQYREAVTKISNDLGLQLIAFGHAMDQYPPEQMVSHDGTHPSAAGHRVIGAMFITALGQSARAGLAELSA